MIKRNKTSDAVANFLNEFWDCELTTIDIEKMSREWTRSTVSGFMRRMRESAYRFKQINGVRAYTYSKKNSSYKFNPAFVDWLVGLSK